MDGVGKLPFSSLMGEGKLSISLMPVLQARTLKTFSFSWEIRKKNAKHLLSLSRISREKAKFKLLPTGPLSRVDFSYL